MIEDMKECPHCGSDEGYYTKDFASGSIQTNYNFDGSEADNTDLYSGLVHKMGKHAYCRGCKVRLFRVDWA